MRAMILAAGRGQRMRPLTDHIPKPLLKVGGKPLIVWHIENLAKAGFKELVINYAHLGEQIERSLGNGQEWGLSIEYSPEKVALETAGGIANALHSLGKSAFLVVNGDTYTTFNFADCKMKAAAMVEKNQSAHLVLINNPEQHTEGDFTLDEHLVGFEGAQKLTFSGIGIYEPRLFEAIKPGEPAKLAPLLRQAMMQQQVSGEHFKGEWHDIGTPERLKALDGRLTNLGITN